MADTGNINVGKMTEEQLDGVMDVEESSFSIPWSRRDFEKELRENNMAVYYTATEDGRVAGYAGMWHVVNEGHITNVAVHPDFRGRGIGSLLMDALEAEARKREMIGLTLEVRVGNAPAQSLYSSHGFFVEGLRKNYYHDTKEDAVIMWKYFESYEDFENTPNFNKMKDSGLNSGGR